MLLKETKLRLIDLFLSFAEEEKDLEHLRQSLCETPSFEPYLAFRRIDSSFMGFLNSENILSFLSSYNFYHNHQNIQFYINHYDQDFDKKLSYLEFLQSVLPQDNSELRFSISQRPIKQAEDFTELQINEIEKKTAFLINKEINFYIKFERDRQNLFNSQDFDILAVVQNLALRDKQEIGFEDLKVFFLKNNVEIKDNDIILILRRIDLNGDGKIDIREFENAFAPKNKYLSEKKTKICSKFNEKCIIPDKNYKKILEEKREIYAKSNNRIFKNKGFNEHFEGIIELLDFYLKVERNYEDLKQELAMRDDFNLFDLFKIFDKVGKGFILASELMDGLNQFDLNPDNDEILVFVRTLNLKIEGKLKFSNFICAFLPRQMEYANILNKRSPKEEIFELKELFNKTTRQLIRKVFETHFENEMFLENLKRILVANASFNIEKVFDFIDGDNDGFLSLHDLRRLFEKANQILTEKQLLILLERFDKDEDSFISFYEFDAEIQPKLTEKELN